MGIIASIATGLFVGWCIGGIVRWLVGTNTSKQIEQLENEIRNYKTI